MAPKCKYFGKCGGCTSQHIDYATQLENKKRLVQQGLGVDDIEVFSGASYEYRNRMDMIFNSKGIGFREKGRWYKIVDIDKCAISNNKLNKLIKEVREFFHNPDYFDIKKKTGTLKYAVIRTPSKSSSISFVLNSESRNISNAIELIKRFSEQTSADNIIITYASPASDLSVTDDYFVVKGKNYLQEEFCSMMFKYPVQGFFQNNSAMAQKMHMYVRKLLKRHNTKDKKLLDLYGGVGCFGIINSKLFKEVWIVEGNEESIEFANINVKDNKAENVFTQVLDAKQIKRLNIKPDFVITDPPRSGMSPKTIQYLKELNPEVIIYVSCNLNQLAKDIKKLNYQIKNAAVFDFFPQTPHVETITELQRV